jgi:hypothetical protein
MFNQSYPIFKHIWNYLNFLRNEQLSEIEKVETTVEVGLVRAGRLRSAFDGRL